MSLLFETDDTVQNLRVVSEHLCGTCRQALRKIETGECRNWDRIDHHQDAESLLRASLEDCYVCSRLKQTYGACTPLSCTMWEVGQKNAHMRYNLKFENTNGDISDYDFKLVLEQHPKHTSRLDELGDASRRSQNTGDAVVMDLIRAWLASDIVRNGNTADRIRSDKNGYVGELTGPEWVNSSRPSARPTRLLDLRFEKVRLVVIQENEPCPTYATLSHVWGDASFFRHILENTYDLQAGVSLDRFPLTFREAMILCRRLNYDYLWIDCYCIIQGGSEESQADWDRESVKMGGIFGKSDLTIAASHGHGPHAGLFKYRDMKGKRPCILYWKPDGHDCYEKWRLLVESGNGKHGRSRQQDKDFLDSEPLYNRAWVLQERVFSKRMLHFGTHQVWLEYFQFSCSESDPEVERSTNKHVFDLRQQGHIGPRYKDQKVSWENWKALVREYTTLKLSHPLEDKLMALAPIARMIFDREHAQLDYLAGVSPWLPEALCWKPVSFRKLAPPSATWRAPTWSWASLDVAVDWPQDLSPRHAFAHVIGWDTELRIPDEPYGPLRWAEMHIAGKLLTASAYQNNHTSKSIFLCPAATHDKLMTATLKMVDSLFEWRGMGKSSFCFKSSDRTADHYSQGQHWYPRYSEDDLYGKWGLGFDKGKLRGEPMPNHFYDAVPQEKLKELAIEAYFDEPKYQEATEVTVLPILYNEGSFYSPRFVRGLLLESKHESWVCECTIPGQVMCKCGTYVHDKDGERKLHSHEPRMCSVFRRIGTFRSFVDMPKALLDAIAGAEKQEIILV